MIDSNENLLSVRMNEDRTMIDIPKRDLPDGAKEGDILVITEDIITIDNEETKKREMNIKNLMDKRWE